MTFTKTALSILALTIVATPVLAQGRYGDQAADNAARRAERAQIRQLEEQYEKEVAAAKAAASAPATPAEVATAPAPQDLPRRPPPSSIVQDQKARQTPGGPFHFLSILL